MKLVDILARELKVWPEQYYQVYQDTGGYLHGTLSDGDAEDCCQEDLPYDPAPIAWHGINAFVTREQWQAAVDALAAQDMHEVALGAEPGILPPVGVRVTIHDDGSLVYGHGESGEVIAHVEGCAVVRMSYGLGCFMAKALRTAEQIAAEERKRDIDEMHRIAGEPAYGSSIRACLGALYDSGYRKQ